MQVKDAEHRFRHKLFPRNAWMKLTDFNILTSCPKDELHQWFLGLYGEHIVPAMVHRCTQVLQRPDLIWHDRNGVAVHIHGICVVYNMYMMVIFFVYTVTCTELIMLTAGLFGT